MQQEQFLFEEYNTLSKKGRLDKTISLNITKNLNQNFQIRDYQKEAFIRFFDYMINPEKKPIHLLFNMATGSGKTFVMASLILSLYEKGYRNFLFFVNSTNIIKKTKENFLNSNSLKYLFNNKINFDGKQVNIKEVNNFGVNNDENINIKFTTIHGLHSDLNYIGENKLSYEDFNDKKIVILSDEAHHINSTTKNTKLNKTEQEIKSSWENTVMNILNSNIENILLEFTATIDLKNEEINKKYIDKIIYKYDLKDFRKDGYSKELDILKADMKQADRVLQALILSQYRLKIAEKNKIFCKPIILFKAQKTIEESKNNFNNFNKLIKILKTDDLEYLKNIANTDVIKKAFKFFEENNISMQNLLEELKDDFGIENCLNANDGDDLVSIKLNTLEDKNNRIRAIFAVAKLNEGWDVLNLFDIVRLYGDDGITANRSNVIDKKTGKVKSGPQTIAEAQLIGRGARYFPFVTEKNIGEDKYKRKFDNKDDELKILETFYYHTFFDNMYITEIRQALKEVGMLDEKDKNPFELKLKNSFILKDFYKNGLVFFNDKQIKDTSLNDSFEKIGLNTKTFDIKITTGNTGIIVVFSDEKNENIQINEKIKTLKLNKEIDKRIIRKAIQKNDFYKFDNLKKYLGKLKSIDEFITGENYLGGIEINLYSQEKVLNNLSQKDLLKAILDLLQKLEIEIKNKEIKYIGTKKFKSDKIINLFKNKTIFPNNILEISETEDWFVFEKIVGTSEEEKFINLFEIEIDKLKNKYHNIYLVRNERVIAIYSFDDGERFEPDFLLFMKEKNTNKQISYQIFIEAKGDGFIANDIWKQKFLLEIEKEHKFEKENILTMDFLNFKLVGLPFYNEKDEEKNQTFKKTFEERFIL